MGSEFGFYYQSDSSGSPQRETLKRGLVRGVRV